MADKTKSQRVAEDVVALLRARNPLLWIVTKEEARVESYIFDAAAGAGYVAWTWDCGQGVADIWGKPVSGLVEGNGLDIEVTLDKIREKARYQPRSEDDGERGLWVLRDLPPWLQGPIGMKTVRVLRNLCRELPAADRRCAQAMVIISPSGDVPPELAGHATVIDWPLPDRAEIAALLKASIDRLPDNLKDKAAPNGTFELAVDSAVGLTGDEATGCYAKAIVQGRGVIDPAIVAAEKKRVIARERILEWFDPLPGGMGAVGGLDCLKSWLLERKAAYSKAAREYGLPAPKGTLLAGIPGCGKSLSAKAVATAWGVPLLKFDLGGLRSKFVGESEANLRRALRVIEAIGRCVVWIDELEKALAGATDGAADGGVSGDLLGTILTWMQDRAGESFVIATANDVSKLPPELMRKGRFDELWFVDLPNAVERSEIIQAALLARKRIALDVIRNESEMRAFTAATAKFTGSEIDALVPDAMFTAFADGKREITVDDLLAAAKRVVPLAETMEDRIAALRKWGSTNARPATTPEARVALTGAGQFDLS